MGQGKFVSVQQSIFRIKGVHSFGVIGDPGCEGSVQRDVPRSRRGSTPTHPQSWHRPLRCRSGGCRPPHLRIWSGHGRRVNRIPFPDGARWRVLPKCFRRWPPRSTTMPVAFSLYWSIPRPLRIRQRPSFLEKGCLSREGDQL